MSDALSPSHLQICEPNYLAFTHFLKPNKPCLFEPSLCEDWPARKHWLLRSDQPNWETLAQEYGAAPVTLWNCTSGHQQEVSLSEALRQMRGHHSVDSTTKERPLLYIKDWHLALYCEQQGLPPFYSTPVTFLDDWMNDFYLSRGEDFRFVYAGLKDSFTGWLSSYVAQRPQSTSADRRKQAFIAMCTVPIHGVRMLLVGIHAYFFCILVNGLCSETRFDHLGRKRWWFVAPQDAIHLRRFPKSRTSEIVSDFRNVDQSVYKNFGQATVHIVDQQEGETIFVPSGWYHMVLNLSDCISINHNW